MDELNHLLKRTGMTVARAWMLMIGVFVTFFLIAVIVGIVHAATSEKPNMSGVMNGMFMGLILCFIIGSLIGYRINKKDIAVLKKITPKDIFWTVLLSVSVGVILPFFSENLRFEIDTKKTSTIDYEWLAPLLSVSLTYFQVGVIGHGLLRNYTFREAILTIMFLCVIMIIPVAVISLAFETVFFFYLYYRTQNISITLLMASLIFAFDKIVKLFLGMKYLDIENYIRIGINNDTQYFILLAIIICLTPFWVYKIVQNKPIPKWRKEDEYEDVFR